MSPLPPSTGLRATLAAWCVSAADALTTGGMTRSLNEADRLGANLDDIERANQRLVSARQAALDAAEEAWGARDRMRGELSGAREDLARIGRVLAGRQLIPATGGPHHVRAAVDTALGEGAATRGSHLGTVASDAAVAIEKWAKSDDGAPLLPADITDLSWVVAAAVSTHLHPELVAKTGGQG